MCLISLLCAYMQVVFCHQDHSQQKEFPVVYCTVPAILLNAVASVRAVHHNYTTVDWVFQYFDSINDYC